MRSASAPKIGCPIPQARFWMAMASENSARGQPNSSAMGIWNTPKEARTAKLSIRMMQPPTRTGVMRGARVMARRVSRFAGRVKRNFLMPRLRNPYASAHGMPQHAALSPRAARR